MRTRCVFAIIATLAGAFYAYPFIRNGWIPQDDGAHAQMAERVTQGETPHVDFDDPYTGGLTFLHALSFAVMGPSLFTIRLAQFVCFTISLPMIFFLAVRTTNAAFAVLFTFLCAVWTLPCWPVPTPNWYSLTICLAGTLAILRYLDTGRARWLFPAGVCGGLAAVIKLPTGAFFAVAGVLFLLYHEHSTQTAPASRHRDRVRCFSVLKTVFLLAIVAGNLYLLRHRLVFMEIMHFVAPCGFLCLMMILLEWKEYSDPDRLRFSRCFRLIGPFTCGCVIPLACLAVYYASGRTVRLRAYEQSAASP